MSNISETTWRARIPSPLFQTATKGSREYMAADGISVAILQKNLQQLDSDLHEALSLPTDRIQTLDHRLSFQEIRAKFLFLNSLLSAELNSRVTKAPHRLQDIQRRLGELDSALHRWESSGLTTDQYLNHFAAENVSTCSCRTEPCIDDDDDDDVGPDDRLGLVGCHEVAAEAQEFLEKEPAAASERGGWEREGRRKSRVWIFMGGMVFGMSLMGCVLLVLPSYLSFVNVEPSSCLLPT